MSQSTTIQTTLLTFFKKEQQPIILEPKRKDFVYYPEQAYATFTDDITASLQTRLVHTTDGIRLWISSEAKQQPHEFRNIEPLHHNVALLKSTLQKAIRRMDTNTALTVAYTMLAIDPMHILRRIPVIAIEDVCLVEGLSVIVWMMMCGKKYILSNYDVSNVLTYIYELLCCSNVIGNKTNSSDTISHKQLSSLPDIKRDDVMALFYRSRFGGMKGDIDMLEQAVKYYMRHPIYAKRFPVRYKEHFDIKPLLYRDNLTIRAGIDFHVYPQMLLRLSQELHIPKAYVQRIIWESESSVNTRKKYVMKRAADVTESLVYRQLKPCLETYRDIIIKNLCKNVELKC